MPNLNPAPGITSKFQLGGQLYTNVSAVAHAQTMERVDTTGLGQLNEAFVPGRKSVLEITVRFYGTAAASGSDAADNLELGAALEAGYVHFSSGVKYAWSQGFAHVVSHSTDASTEGAVEHEVTIALQSFTTSYESI